MKKILIVDDNKVIRQSIVARINWHDLDMRVCGQASNGQEALKLIKTLNPDVVITDVKMPLVDGFSLIERAQETVSHIQFIVISGYDYFEYAKKAISFGVLEYILKPIETEELISALTKASDEVDLLNKATHNNTIMQLSSMYKGICNNNIQQNQLFDKLKTTVKDINERIHTVISVSITGTIKFPTTETAFLGRIKSMLEHSKQGLVCMPWMMNRRLMYIHLIHNGNPLHREVIKILVRTIEKDYLEQIATSKLYISVSDASNDIKQIKELINQSYSGQFLRFWSTKEYVFVYKNISEKLEIKNIFWEELFIQLTQGRSEIVHSQINQLFKDISKNIVLRKDLSFVILKLRLFLKPDEVVSLDIGKWLLKFENIKDLQAYMLKEVDENLKNIYKDQSNYLIDDVVAYIEENYMKPLTLAQLSSIFHMNTTYLGQLVKERLGVSFNKYLNNIRINKAKTLMLKYPNIKFIDIAENIGYTDAQYFSKTFKSLTGYSPSAFKIMKSIH